MWFLLTLGLVAPAAAEEHPDFTGAWLLDPKASDGADALLAAWGVSWLERQAAKAVVPTQTITVSGHTLTLVIDASLASRTETLDLDGAIQTTTSRSGVPVTTRTGWVGSALVTTSETTGPDGGPVRLIATRTLEDGGGTMRQRIEVVRADGTVLAADRVFHRQ